MLQSICLKYLTPSLYILNPLMKPFAAVDIFDSFRMLMAHNGFSMRHYHFFFNHLNSTLYVNTSSDRRQTNKKKLLILFAWKKVLQPYSVDIKSSYNKNNVFASRQNTHLVLFIFGMERFLADYNSHNFLNAFDHYFEGSVLCHSFYSSYPSSSHRQIVVLFAFGLVMLFCWISLSNSLLTNVHTDTSF